MTHYDPANAEVFVLAFKEGLLSPIAHDLKLQVTVFEIEVDEQARTARARFDPTSLRVVCAIKEGREDFNLLSEADKSEIERNIRREVLEADGYPSIVFESSAFTKEKLSGGLVLHGSAREVHVSWREKDGSILAEARLDQRDFGITPFRAFLGTLKVKPEVIVRARLPLPRRPNPGL